jgi:mRNA-degrading endonuclease RelE of RelBE toxin-antitoxin system
MKEYKTSNLFKKNTKNLKSKLLINLLNKIDEICNCEDLNHYKNLRYDLKKYKRVHINNSYVILFFEKKIVYFADYEHHDKIYKQNKKFIRKYNNLDFS